MASSIEYMLHAFLERLTDTMLRCSKTSCSRFINSGASLSLMVQGTYFSSEFSQEEDGPHSESHPL
eukprot:5151093-Amphidinium_carterae.1